jgi:hypothetical protein
MINGKPEHLSFVFTYNKYQLLRCCLISLWGAMLIVLKITLGILGLIKQR